MRRKQILVCDVDLWVSIFARDSCFGIPPQIEPQIKPQTEPQTEPVDLACWSEKSFARGIKKQGKIKKFATRGDNVLQARYAQLDARSIHETSLEAWTE